MPRPDPGDPPADETLHQLVVRESEWRNIPLAALARASLLAASETRFAITSDGALAPNWREQLKNLAAAVELRRDGGRGHTEPWSQLKLFRTKSADYLAWLNSYLAQLNDSGALARWLEDPPSSRPKPDRETREARRRASIKRFAEQQRRLRQWISVPDLTDWCAQSTTTAGVAEQAKARDLPLELFADSILKAEFEREGRSKILFLSSRVTGRGSIPCRLKREGFERQCRYAAKMTPAAPLPLEVLARCWLPRELARQWIEAHGYRWPPHLDPEKRPDVLVPGESLHWRPLSEAVHNIAHRLGIPTEQACTALKDNIGAGEIKARCRAIRRDRQQGQRIETWRDLDPRWLGFIAYAYPQDDHLRFDTAAAARARMAGEQLDLPPEHARDILLEAARLDELYPPVAAENLPPALGRRDGRKGGTRRPSRLKPFWAEARKAAFEWFDEKGFPSPGDGGQAKLERHIARWITDRGHEASPSTVRVYVKRWIEEYKASITAFG
jgi:hypothetical protein